MNSRFLPLGVVPGKQFSFSLTLVLVQPACTTCVYYLRVQPACTTYQCREGILSGNCITGILLPMLTTKARNQVRIKMVNILVGVDQMF